MKTPLDQQIVKAQERVAVLKERAWESKDPLLTEALEVLSVSLEELKVAGKELLQQNEELTTSHQRDITERKRAEKSLQENEERFRNLYEQMPLGYQSLNAEGCLIEVNQSWLDLLGYTHQEVIGRWFGDFLAPHEVEAFKQRFRLFKANDAVHVDVEMVRRAGSSIIVHIDGRIGRDEYGQFKQTHCILHDITERIQVEMRLRESEEKYRSLASAEDSMYLVDRECRFRFMNDAHLSRFSLSLAEVIGRSYGEFHSEEDSREFTGIVKEVFETNTSFQVEHKSERDPKYYLRTFSPVRDPQGNITSVTVISKDITRRKQTEQELLKYQQQLQSLAIRMSEMEELERKEIARTLHDLVGQNLTALSLNLNIMFGLMPEDQKSFLFTRMEDSQKLLEETTQHIREVMADLRPSVLDDFGLLAALHWYGQRFSERTGIQTVFEGEDFLSCLSPIMETIIFRIVQEALTNVLKHASADRVELRLEKIENWLHLKISDNGIGFLFKGFHFEGEKRGWGLATMRERAMAMGGDLAVFSEPGKGTQIILQLPVERK
jgi:PAS domain S-box-containing protein